MTLQIPCLEAFRRGSARGGVPGDERQPGCRTEILPSLGAQESRGGGGAVREQAVRSGCARLLARPGPACGLVAQQHLRVINFSGGFVYDSGSQAKTASPVGG